MYDSTTTRRRTTIRIVVLLVTGCLLAAGLGALLSHTTSPDEGQAPAAAPDQAGSTGLGTATPDGVTDAGANGTGEGAAGTGEPGTDGQTGPDGDGGDTGDGGDDGDGGDGGGEGVEGGVIEIAPSPEHCFGYDPADLTITQAGALGWDLRDDGILLARLDTKTDAEHLRGVARRHTKTCLIGHGNDRPDQQRYVVRYWKGSSGLPLGIAPTFDCVGYDPKLLVIHKDGDAGWRLNAGDTALLLLDTASDAVRAKLVAAAKTKLCFVGRLNDRPDPHLYIVEYWRD